MNFFAKFYHNPQISRNDPSYRKYRHDNFSYDHDRHNLYTEGHFHMGHGLDVKTKKNL